MSPVFRHGSLRLYLLKLLDEAPRHGYEVIRLLQDRFLGVYAPSPGTIYPRLARLEEEGLVTHDEIDGKKVYRITDRGREELHARFDDLAELEEEITASVRDIAREVSEDVRETVRNLREELTSAARDMQGRGRPRPGRDDTRSAQREAGRARGGKGGGRARKGKDAWDEATGDEATGDDTGWPLGGRERPGRGWGDWSGWAGGQDWGGWPGAGGPHGHRTYRDLERLARQFARELRMAAWHTQAVSEDALSDLRVILDETLDRIRTEVFATPAGRRQPKDSAAETGPPPEAHTDKETHAEPGPDAEPDRGGDGTS
ncbi:MAG TPA: PadR family transcriptional regulator [Streptosporangiaceae bacterium]|nr:PadR family transcriptional regulator [Streptosporangiaceae bacterium]